MKLPVYLKVDLTTRAVEQMPISEEYFRLYVGGKSLAARLLLDLTEEGLDPLCPEAVCIINTGPLTGTGAPSTSRFNMTFKNVMTGGIGTSNCGGQLGVMLRRCGYDGLILTGRAEGPTVLEITDGEVSFRDGSELWGLDMEQTQQALPEHYGKLVIGPAGEHLVRYASAGSGERMAGRCGGGAVLGSKNLKAVIAYGTGEIPVARPEKFRRYVKRWINFTRKHPMTGDALPRYGSAGLVNKANATHSLPTHNFKYGHFDKADAVSGETMAETALTRNAGCVSCPIRCERRVKVENKEVKGPEYETLGLFGPNMDSDDLQAVLKLNYTCDLLGLDTISCAATIAFAMELKERGMADFGVEFGKVSELPRVVEQIAHREGIYSELANGSKWMSEKYGGGEFAIHSKGLELASYEPRRSVGMGLGYATSNRGGCHLNGGYVALLESIGVLMTDAQTTRSKAELTVFLQNSLESVSSAGCCLFSAQTFVPAIFFKLGPTHPVTRMVGGALAHMGPGVRLLLAASRLLRINTFYYVPHVEGLRLASGLPMYMGPFMEWGDRTFNLERLYNLREGLGGESDSLPGRLTREPQDPKRPDTVVRLDEMLPKYYAVRGWDDKGVPTEKRLRRLKIR